MDTARWTGDFPHVDKPADGQDMEKWWRNRAKDFVFCPFYITHGPTQYHITIDVTKDGDGKNQLKVKSVEKQETNQQPGETFPPYYSQSPEFVCRPPLGIPSQGFEPIIEKNPASGPAGSILLRIAKSGRTPSAPDPDAKKIPQPDTYRYWLDPKRDYAVLQWDMVGTDAAGKEELLSRYIVEELKQSPKGIWYATRFRVKAVPPVEHDQVFDVYIDFDAKLPDSLFASSAVGQLIQ
jgi:hypothetical protein